MTTNEIIPAIRFKGFKEEWEEEKFGRSILVINGRAYSQNELLSLGKYKVLRVGNFYTNDSWYFSNLELADKYYAIAGDLLYTWSASFGPHIWNGDKVIYHYHIWKFLLDDHLDKFFVLHLLNNDRKKILEDKNGSTMIHITKSGMEAKIIAIPSPAEQTKIGNYFRDLDSLIRLHEQKLDKISDLKNAMLVKMFAKENADIPEVRFKGFKEKWKEFAVKNLCSISTGMSNTQDREMDGKFPFYVRSATIEKSNRFLFDQEAVLTVGDGVGTGKVFHYVNGKYDLHQRVYRMFDFRGILGKYFYHIFSKDFNKRVMSMTAKTSVDSVRLEMISEMKVKLPCIDEQKVIVKYLDNLDRLINQSQRKIEQLKHLKQAMLQKMFI